MRKFRAYFNKRSEAPAVWSIDEGSQDSEINIINFVIGTGCKTESFFNGEKPNENSPVAWFEITAVGFSIHRGIAYFTGENECATIAS